MQVLLLSIRSGFVDGLDTAQRNVHELNDVAGRFRDHRTAKAPGRGHDVISEAAYDHVDQ